MADPVLIAKAVAAVVSDERLRKGVGWGIVAILSPVIVVAALLCSLGTGAADQNVSIVELCFNGGTIPDIVSEEYRVHIVDMQARVSSEFGYRNCPYHGRELHSGLDMAAPTGTPIRAALSGTVTKSTYTSSYGNYTMIDHGNGLTTAYAHQSQRLVAVGDQVEAGDVIGLVGSTGNSTGPHLHLEVRVNGELQNPRYYLP